MMPEPEFSDVLNTEGVYFLSRPTPTGPIAETAPHAAIVYSPGTGDIRDLEVISGQPSFNDNFGTYHPTISYDTWVPETSDVWLAGIEIRTGTAPDQDIEFTHLDKEDTKYARAENWGLEHFRAAEQTVGGLDRLYTAGQKQQFSNRDSGQGCTRI